MLLYAIEEFRSLKTAIGKINKAFIIVVSIGDLLQGIFLIGFAIADDFINKSTCTTQFVWMTYPSCTALGVLSTMGSLITLYSMAILSVVRVHGVCTMAIPTKEFPTKVKVKLTLVVSGVFLVAGVISVIPTVDWLENFFVLRLIYEGNPIFIGGPDKDRHMDIFQTHFGRILSNDMSWGTNRRLVQDMFINGEVEGRRLGFYGSNGYCLFDYFKRDVPMEWFTGAVLGVNLLCVIIITLCYTIVNIAAYRSSAVAGPLNKNLTKRNRKMQRKISILILTDIITWIPFIMSSLIIKTRILDPTPWLSYLSIIFLPFNSVINPIGILEEKLRKVLQQVRGMMPPLPRFSREHQPRLNGQFSPR